MNNLLIGSVAGESEAVRTALLMLALHAGGRMAHGLPCDIDAAIKQQSPFMTFESRSITRHRVVRKNIYTGTGALPKAYEGIRPHITEAGRDFPVKPSREQLEKMAFLTDYFREGGTTAPTSAASIVDGTKGIYVFAIGKAGQLYGCEFSGKPENATDEETDKEIANLLVDCAMLKQPSYLAVIHRYGHTRPQEAFWASRLAWWIEERGLYRGVGEIVCAIVGHNE